MRRFTQIEQFLCSLEDGDQVLACLSSGAGTPSAGGGSGEGCIMPRPPVLEDTLAFSLLIYIQHAYMFSSIKCSNSMHDEYKMCLT